MDIYLCIEVIICDGHIMLTMIANNEHAGKKHSKWLNHALPLRIISLIEWDDYCYFPGSAIRLLRSENFASLFQLFQHCRKV